LDSYAKQETLRRIRDAGIVSRDAKRRTPVSVNEDRHSVIERFAEYAAEYQAHVVRVGRAQIPETILRLLAERESTRVVVPSDLDPAWAMDDAIKDNGFDHAALAGFQAVVTGCSVAIAETGTIVLDAGPGQGRRALTLIPDHHICVVLEEQVVAGVNEAVAWVADAARNGRPMTWISGPSATSDIELSRVEGVHGPRKLDVILAA
jgi:L-lactate dehydrogenase complex protein LldG